MFEIKTRDIVIPIVLLSILMFSFGCGVNSCISAIPDPNFEAAWDVLWSQDDE